jgi:hypothetical protein
MRGAFEKIRAIGSEGDAAARNVLSWMEWKEGSLDLKSIVILDLHDVSDLSRIVGVRHRARAQSTCARNHNVGSHVRGGIGDFS